MIVGDTKTIYAKEVADVPFIVSSATLSFVNEVGTSQSPSVTIDNSSANLSHIMYGTINAVTNDAGPCFARWNFHIGNQIINRVYPYFVSFYDFHTIFRERTHLSQEQFSDQHIDQLMVSIHRFLVRSFPDCFGLLKYKNLDQNYVYYYDNALALFAAGYALLYTPNYNPVTPLIGVRIGNDAYTYGDLPVNYKTVGPEFFADQAINMLRNFPCFQALFDSLDKTPMFQPSGKRRAVVAQAGNPLRPLYSLYNDIKTKLEWTGSTDGSLTISVDEFAY